MIISRFFAIDTGNRVGYNLAFDSIPEAGTISLLKAAKLRYNKRNGTWWTLDQKTALRIAKIIDPKHPPLADLSSDSDNTNEATISNNGKDTPILAASEPPLADLSSDNTNKVTISNNGNDTPIPATFERLAENQLPDNLSTNGGERETAKMAIEPMQEGGISEGDSYISREQSSSRRNGSKQNIVPTSDSEGLNDYSQGYTPSEFIIPNGIGSNFLVPTDYDTPSPTHLQRMSKNIEALGLLVSLENGQTNFTLENYREVHRVLSEWTGWGGLNEILKLKYASRIYRNSNRGLDSTNLGRAAFDRLVTIYDFMSELDPEGSHGVIKAASLSSLNAFYSNTQIIRPIWEIIKRLGFSGGKILEPSAGRGSFFAAMPAEMMNNSSLWAVEKDYVTGKILSYLYPDANVKVMGLEEAKLPNGYFDLIISNIPFGSYKIFDKEYANNTTNKTRQKSLNKIQDYFFVKSIDLLREGGILAFITSSGTLNSSTSHYMLEHINETCNFLGAIRLPSSLFDGTAGTEVSTDLVILQKRGRIIANPMFTSTVQVIAKSIDNNQEFAIQVNEYFHNNPQYQIGETRTGGTYSASRINIVSPLSIDEISDKVVDIGEEMFPYPVFQSVSSQTIQSAAGLAYRGNLDFLHPNNIVVEDNVLLKLVTGPNGMVAENYNKVIFTERTSNKAKQRTIDLFEKYAQLRKWLKVMFDFELNNDEDNESLHRYRDIIKRAYEEFTGKYGFLNSRENRVLLHDVDASLVFSLERHDPLKGWVKSDIFTERTLRAIVNRKADTIADAIAISMDENNRIVPSRIAELLGVSIDRIEWGNEAFEQPNGTVLPQFEYLNGNVVQKLKAAETAAAIDPKFKKNVAALLSVIPKKLPLVDISVSPSARWIPSGYINEFCQELLGSAFSAVYVEVQSAYKIIKPGNHSIIIANNSVWAAKPSGGFNFVLKYGYEILTALLNDRRIVIKDKIMVGQKETEIVDKEATAICEEKVAEMMRKFQHWIASDEQRRTTIESIYNETFNVYYKNKHTGYAMTFPGLQLPQDYVISDYQREAISMLMRRNGGIVDHAVGSGKTAVMIVAAMKGKQLGIFNKPCLVLLKSTVPQVVATAIQYYPSAKILYPNELDFSKTNRRQFLAKIASNNWDLILLSHEQLSYLPDDPDIAILMSRKEIQLLDDAMFQITDVGKNSGMTVAQLKGLEIRKQNLLYKIQELSNVKKDPHYLHFGLLGIDHLFVDEAHRFKNLQYTTTHNQVSGLGPPVGSKRAWGLYVMAAAIRRRYHNGENKGLTFLTGTPITNSIVELFTLLRFMQPVALAKMQMESFDAWAANFARRSNEIEFDVSGGLKIKERFRSFVNVPELVALYVDCADVRTDENLPELQKRKPQLRHGEMRLILSPISCEQQQVMLDMVELLRGVLDPALKYLSKNMSKDVVERAKGLLATNIASKASVDIRLLERESSNDYGNKLNELVRNIAAIYYQTTDQLGVQLVFSNTGVPGNNERFGVYDHIKSELVKRYKIPPNEVAFIHSYENKAAKSRLFQETNDGKIRVLLGSTEKLGTGVNVQSRICALHHLDLQWTPALLEQRNGRGLRQGNLYQRADSGFTIPIFVYATERTLDAYKFELLRIKTGFINQVRLGAISERIIDEGDASSSDDNSDSASIGLSTMVALVSGNKWIKEVARLQRKLSDVEIKKRVFDINRAQSQEEITKLKNKRVWVQEEVEMLKVDYDALKKAGALDSNGKYKTSLTLRDGTVLRKAKDIGAVIMAGQPNKIIGTIPFSLMVKRDTLGINIKIMGASGREYTEYLPFVKQNEDNISAIITRKMNNIATSMEIWEREMMQLEKSYAHVERQSNIEWDDTEYQETRGLLRVAIKNRDESATKDGNGMNLVAGCRKSMDKPPIDVLENPKAVYDYGKLPDLSKLDSSVLNSYVAQEVSDDDDDDEDNDADDGDTDEGEADNDVTESTSQAMPITKEDIAPSNIVEIQTESTENELQKRLKKYILAFNAALDFAENEIEISKINSHLNAFNTALEFA